MARCRSVPDTPAWPLLAHPTRPRPAIRAHTDRSRGRDAPSPPLPELPFAVAHTPRHGPSAVADPAQSATVASTRSHLAQHRRVARAIAAWHPSPTAAGPLAATVRGVLARSFQAIARHPTTPRSAAQHPAWCIAVAHLAAPVAAVSTDGAAGSRVRKPRCGRSDAAGVASGPELVWGFCCQALFVGFIFILSFSSFFVRLKSRFFALACILRVRRAQRRSTLAKGHRRRRRAAVLTIASTAQR